MILNSRRVAVCRLMHGGSRFSPVNSWPALLLPSLVLVCSTLLPVTAAIAAPPTAPLSPPVSFDFVLPNVDGTSFKLNSVSNSRLRVIAFLGCECPLAIQYGPRLQQLSDAYRMRGVEFVGVNSNVQDSQADVIKYVSTLELKFPVLKDHDRVVAAALEATRTPEVIVLNGAGQVVYRGRIDDQYQPGIVKNHPSREDLKIALDEALAGKPISVPRADAFGCLIAKPRSTVENASVTYCGQIARLINEHCIECHRAGEIGPFAMDNYDEVVGWADMMLETVQEQRMPPWNANPEHGEFLNARSMPIMQRELLAQWVASGTPYGDPRDLPGKESQWSAESIDRQADFSIAMSDQPFAVPADGTIEYQYFVVDPQFKEDRWVNSAELIPGDRSVVHHGIVFIRAPDGQRLDGVGWLTAYVPGQRIPHSPTYRARRVPAGSKLVFQMHYTPNGKATEDLTRLDLRFSAAEEVTEELTTLISINQELEIPPQLDNVPVTAQTVNLPADGVLLALSPHMHLRGKTMKVQAIHESGSEKVLLDVPKYDFNWQHTYILKDPLPLKEFSKLSFVATYDNSINNPFNPDPDDFVTWGDQTWEEMAIVFYEVARPLANHEQRAARRSAKSEGVDSELPPILERHQILADEYMKSLDRNQDGKLTYEEVDRAVQLEGFKNLDRNRDRMIDRDELLDTLRRTR
jgi:thiol-disulfide isomerase/thioredoxin